MALIDRLRDLLSPRARRERAAVRQLQEGVSAAMQLPPPAEPKVKPKQQSYPGYVRSTKPSESVIPRTDLNLASTQALTLRTTSSDTREIIRKLTKATPDLSAAVWAYARTVVTPTYTATARNLDGTFNREATVLLHSLLQRFDVLHDYNDGFSGIWSMRALSESLVGELVRYGACSFELVLDKARLPRTLSPVSVLQIQFREDDRWLAPVQRVGSEEIDLDYPTFFYSSLDQDLLEAYADSPLEPAIQAVLADHQFFDDLQRLVRRALHPRLDVDIDYEKFVRTIPPDVLADQEGRKAYVDGVIQQITDLVNGLNPEDALVHFDFIKFAYLNHGTASPASEEETLLSLSRSRVSAGAKTLPSILGHGDANQNLASAEAMLFMKSAGAVQGRINDLYSRALTLALRLMGEDVAVRFAYDPINLRPEDELEAFRAMRQDRILSQLSYGFITDDEASIQLTGSVTPAGFTPLSGTMFYSGSGGVSANPYSPTGAQGDSQGPQNRALNPGTPQQKRGGAQG